MHDLMEHSRIQTGPRHRSRPVRIRLLGAVASVACLSVGIGVGLRWALLDGLSVESAVGLLFLAAGSVLAVRAVADFVRTRRGLRRVTVVPLVLLIGWFAVWPPSVALMATHVPPSVLGDRTPADLGLDFEDVEFSTTDGVRLSAWYVEGSNGAAIVLRHGSSSTRSAMLDEADVLARHGYAVLLTDARGHGRSEGTAMDFGWFGDSDIEAAVGFLASQAGVDASRIAVLGQSMGGEEALGAAASNPRIRAVVADGASGRTLADKDLTLPDNPLRWFNVARDWLTFGITDWLTSARPPIGLQSASVATAPRPVLLVAGSEALGGEVTAGRRLAAQFDHVELWEVPGAGHGNALDVAPTEWEQRVVGFLDAVLATS